VQSDVHFQPVVVGGAGLDVVQLEPQGDRRASRAAHVPAAKDPARRQPTFKLAVLWVVLLTLPLVACGRKEPDPNAMFGSSVTAMDHDPTYTFVRNVYVNGRWVGQGGTGASDVMGGIALPNRWHPGLTAVVKWERCDPFDPEHPVPDEKACRWTEKVVPIQQYEDVGHTDLHLLPDDKVLIIPTMLAPNHPDYPGPGYPTKDFFNMQPQSKGDAE